MKVLATIAYTKLNEEVHECTSLITYDIIWRNESVIKRKHETQTRSGIKGCQKHIEQAAALSAGHTTKWLQESSEMILKRNLAESKIILAYVRMCCFVVPTPWMSSVFLLISRKMVKKFNYLEAPWIISSMSVSGIFRALASRTIARSVNFLLNLMVPNRACFANVALGLSDFMLLRSHEEIWREQSILRLQHGFLNYE